ncbi:LysR family transcriptional regulator [Planomonospora algeriensis]
MELRDIEIFLTLAEELHFGRTATRLRLSPARVTQAIQKQERLIGAPLFERTNRLVRLTPVGRQLRDDLRPLHAGLRESVQRAQLTGQGITGTLRVGLLPANIHDLRPYWDAFRLRHPQWPDIVYLPVHDIGPLPFAPVWRSEAENELIRSLADVIRDLGSLPPEG